jgi:hypothetical protein
MNIDIPHVYTEIMERSRTVGMTALKAFSFLPLYSLPALSGLWQQPKVLIVKGYHAVFTKGIYGSMLEEEM